MLINLFYRYDLSYIIFKNPNSGVVLKSIRKGVAYGFYPKDQKDKYVIYFRDNCEEISYKEDIHQ